MTIETKNLESADVHNEALRRVLHDLSNTLTGLLMNAGLLNLALRSNEKLCRYAEEITEAGEHSAVLVKQARSMVSPTNRSERETEVTDNCDKETEVTKVIELLHLPPISRRTQ